MGTEDRRHLRILVVVGHPHDFTHCAGTCGLHTQAGDSVTVVCTSDGTSIHNERLYDELRRPRQERDEAILEQSKAAYAEQKAQELAEAASLFGVTDVRVLPHAQPFRVSDVPEAIVELRDILLSCRPQIVISHSPFLRGPHGMASLARDDHTESAVAIHEAMILAATPDPVSGEIPHTVASVIYQGIDFVRDEIDFYVDITEWKDRRTEAEAIFESQGHSQQFAARRVEVIAGSIGWFAGVRYAEGFVRSTPEVLPMIEVSDFSLKRSEEPRMNHLLRLSGELGE